MEKYCGFHGSIGITKLSSEIACVVGLGHARPPSNHESFPITKLFHLKRFAIYGNKIVYT